jgi:hypothetical protein
MNRRGVESLAVGGFFIALTIFMTWPQAIGMGTHATLHQDVYFNMWRLGWFAHALVTPSAHLFDANIFYPEPLTLALSDAMPVEGIIAAPLLWAGVNPVLVHNLLLLGAIAVSGMAMYALVRYLTGFRGAAILAGVVFAFVPYRYEHFMHMELQWTMWMPLAFLGLHRTFETGKWKHGIATGTCVALQMLSSIYYGIFLATLLAGGAVCLFLVDRRVPWRRAALVLAAGAVITVATSAIYAQPYLRVHDRVGDRPAQEVATYSARPASYLAASPSNWFYGWKYGIEGPERRLFPGAIPVLLAIIGLLLQVPSGRALVYLMLLVAAFEMSLGFRGYSYSFLHDHVSVYRGLRAAARLGILVVMFLGVLAGYGYQALAASCSVTGRRVLLAALLAGLLAEYHATLTLVPIANTTPPVYRLLARQPRGVVAEFPVPRADALPGLDAEYAFMSTFHWFPLVNGYSGNIPESYLARLDRLRGFPDQRSLLQLRRDAVRYLIVHTWCYEDEEVTNIRTHLYLAGMVELGSFDDWYGHALLYRMR